jgi:hypothetical protein
VGREIVEAFAVDLVTGADADGFEAVEDVDLGERDAGDAADGGGLADEDGVEPAATALAAGNGAELPATLAEALADVALWTFSTSSVGKGPEPTRVV